MKNYFVYQHIRLDKNIPFYIGIGKLRTDVEATTTKMKHYRAYSKQGRNPIWKNIVKKSPYRVEIIKTGITFIDAAELEIHLIKYYGRLKYNTGQLSNIADGGETVKEDLITVLNDPKCSKVVYQYSLSGIFIKKWESANEIKRQLGFNNSVIRKALNGRTKSPNISYNFQWYDKYLGKRIKEIVGGKTTLKKGVKLIKNEEVLIFSSRQECAEYFNVNQAQIANALREKTKFKTYNIENYDNK